MGTGATAMLGSAGVVERSSCYWAVVGGKNGRNQRVSFVDGKPREPHFTHGPEVIRLPRYGSWNDYAYIAEHQEPRPFYVGERHNSKEGLTQPWKGSTDLQKKSDFKERPSVDELLENFGNLRRPWRRRIVVYRSSCLPWPRDKLSWNRPPWRVRGPSMLGSPRAYGLLSTGRRLGV